MEAYKQDIDEAVRVMRGGGIILYPTDTIWGIGCDATNPDAVRRIFELKQRDDAKSMLVLIGHDALLPSLVETVPDIAYDLIDMSIRPLTIIYEGAKGVAPNLIPEGTIGIRVTKESFSQALCQRMRTPIVSTSANISGSPAPALYQDISQEIRSGVDYIVRYRQDDPTISAPSQILMLGANAEIKIIRQ